MREIDVPTRAHRKTLEVQIAAVLRANGWGKVKRARGNVWLRAPSH